MKAEVRHTNDNDVTFVAKQFGVEDIKPNLVLNITDAIEEVILSNFPPPASTGMVKKKYETKYGILTQFHDIDIEAKKNSKWSRPLQDDIRQDGHTFYCSVYDASARESAVNAKVVAYVVSDTEERQVTVYTDNVEFLNDCLEVIHANKLHGQMERIQKLQKEGGDPISQTI